MTVEQPAEFKQLDQILQLLGDPGRFQIIQFIILSFTYVPVAINDFVVIFYGLLPTSVRCYGDPWNSLLDLDNRNTSTGNAHMRWLVHPTLFVTVHKVSNTHIRIGSGPSLAT